MAAIVFGNSAYPAGDTLVNPVNDATDLGVKLKSYGFDVIVATDRSVKSMHKDLKEFSELLKVSDVGLFFFAGHGMQIEGENYLLALDTDMESELDAQHSSLPLNKVVGAMAKSTAQTKIIILARCLPKQSMGTQVAPRAGATWACLCLCPERHNNRFRYVAGGSCSRWRRKKRNIHRCTSAAHRYARLRH